MIASIWYFFSLIMISSYTANLAACLTVENYVSPINDVEELAAQTKIKYGVVKGGSTFKFFESHNKTSYQTIYKFMEKNADTVYMQSNDLGLAEVKKQKGGYAFFMESVTIDYAVERECELTQIGSPLDSKGYGIGFLKGSNLTKPFSQTLLNLTEKGIVNQLYAKWWKEKRGGGQCAIEEGGGAEPLGIPNLAGVFGVLVLGNTVASLLSVFEFIWETGKVAKEEKISFMKEVRAEMKFICKCRGSSKPARTHRKDGSEDDEEEAIRTSFNNGESTGDKIIK